jgi:hypothetical protein
MRLAMLANLVLAGFATPFFVGCGPAKAMVNGEVTVNGKLLKNGVIVFADAEGSKGDSVTASIQDGKYQLTTTLGKKTVQISAPIVIDKRKEFEGPDAQWVEITEEWLPDRYNAKTELTYEVIAGANTKKWELKAKPR